MLCMMIARLSISLLLLASHCALAALVPPTSDPFYVPNGAWASTKPGTILKSRPVPNPLVNFNYSAAYQLLYRTTNALGGAAAAVTTVILPLNPDYSKLLSYQIIYDTPDVNCSPSYALQGTGGFNTDTQFEQCLGLGWMINAPDYEETHGAKSAGVLTGQATLDSIRAALASTNITGVYSNATVALWGYSGGALPTEWALELQPSYAPELSITGAAMGGLAPNITSVFLTINKSAGSGLLIGTLVGLGIAYPGLGTFMNSSFISTAQGQKFNYCKNLCLTQLEQAYRGQDIYSYFKQGPAFLSDPHVTSVFQRTGYLGVSGTPRPSERLYIYQSVFDEISAISFTDALVQKYCKAGVNIQYVRDNFGNHAQEAANGGPGAFQFLQTLFNGSNSQSGCSIVTRNQNGTILSSSSISPPASSTTSPASIKASVVLSTSL